MREAELSKDDERKQTLLEIARLYKQMALQIEVGASSKTFGRLVRSSVKSIRTDRGRQPVQIATGHRAASGRIR
jgi:hypothetical protein